MIEKKFHVELYNNDYLQQDLMFDSKNEQLEHYYYLLNHGYKRKDVLKRTRIWYT